MDSEPTGDLRSVPVEKLTAMLARCEHLETGLRELAAGRMPDTGDGADPTKDMHDELSDAVAEFAQTCLDEAPPTGRPNRG